MTRPSKTVQTGSDEITAELTAADAIAAPSSGLFNPALAAAPLLMAQDMAIGAFECWRVGLAAMRTTQDELQRAWRQQSDAALQAWAAAAQSMFEAAAVHQPAATPADDPLPANDSAANPASMAAQAQQWFTGAQALTPFAVQVSAPWWSLLLDHDRRPPA
jgi:hypothetical protein